MTLFREQLERIAVPPNAEDGLTDHCTIDRTFLSELAVLALRGLDATETAQGALAILNVHKLEKAKSYDEGFKAGFAALEAKGMVVAPRDATPAMLDAGVAYRLNNAITGDTDWSTDTAALYRAMIDAR